MNASDLRTLCTALSFTVVASKEGGTGNAGRAKALALLIEEFCRTTQRDETMGQGTITGLWSCTPRDGYMALEAQTTSGTKTMIAELRAKPGADQAAVASSIVTALNESTRKDALIAELTACLEMCHEGEMVPPRAKKVTRI